MRCAKFRVAIPGLPLVAPTYILTAGAVTCEQALEIYRRRWGIEVFFRTFKQTFQRRKSRSTGATNAPLELEWSLVASWGMCLIGEESVHKTGVKISRLRPLKAPKAFSSTIRDYRAFLSRAIQGREID